ncbi:MAG: polysaccharide biosynthesis/export family protein [Verrucomicrobia bacterium]|nr:polysaccharide biosynthesis/export family protein [Verrucomicrobiota bacterium]
MKKNSSTETARNSSAKQARGFVPQLPLIARAVLAGVIMVVVAGCDSAKPKVISQVSSYIGALKLREGDTIKIAFPGTPSLDTTQQIRRDGKIALALIGEVKASGLTPTEFEKNLVKLYASEIVSKEVNVTVITSNLPIYVNGAVLRAGKILSDHPITALEAIMECGGFDFGKANTAAVTVIRYEDNQVKTYSLNLKLALEGQQVDPFYLKANDIIYVPERFAWF